MGRPPLGKCTVCSRGGGGGDLRGGYVLRRPRPRGALTIPSGVEKEVDNGRSSSLRQRASRSISGALITDRV